MHYKLMVLEHSQDSLSRATVKQACQTLAESACQDAIPPYKSVLGQRQLADMYMVQPMWLGHGLLSDRFALSDEEAALRR
mmetsp:Transcript_129619/g.252406  ORF Transcript_129619/g.252406 Transcript_129619/m.252406 type:complete len:80 (+) Transcript_129619:159-398(+)